MSKPKILERDIQKSVKEWLQYQGWFVWKNHQALGSHKGVADPTAIKDGRTMFIEIKTPRGSLSAHQERFKSDVVGHGGEYCIARCVEDVETAIALQNCENVF